MSETIDNAEELNALPDRSIVLDADDVVYRRNPWLQHDPPAWFPLDGGSAFDREFGAGAEDVAFPVRVLHRGE